MYVLTKRVMEKVLFQNIIQKTELGIKEAYGNGQIFYETNLNTLFRLNKKVKNL